MLVKIRSIAIHAAVSLFAGIAVLTDPVAAQESITTPKQQLGFNIGDDYHLATYSQLSEYWHKLEYESPRMRLEEIGRTAEGRPQFMAIITSPENQRNLAHYKDISRRLALAEGLTPDVARELANEGRAVVWIDGGLHATEVLGAHQLMEFVYQMVSRTDGETVRILDDVIILAVHANPDGMELVSNWYMREPDPTKRRSGDIPRLYQKYVGHDNNRDFYLVAQPETENMARILYREWFPQILYNHHQVGPAGTVMWAPPFRDPPNYNFDPLVSLGIEMVGNAMHSRFIVEGKRGVTTRSGGPFSTWWNGGLRTTAYFHNIIGLLTETIGNPTPVDIPLIPARQLRSKDNPFPIEPQEWHFRQSIDYSLTANMAVLDYAARFRETLLYNMYRMARNSIDYGSRDHWTIHPKRIEALRAAVKAEGAEPETIGPASGALAGYFSRGVPKRFLSVLHDPKERDPRGYILPASQPDFPTATKFVNTLIKNGVTVLRATGAFAVGDKRYSPGSYVVKTAQAFRPHILDMFEPQDHPNDFAYEGGPPTPPYDNAGYTLAYLMGVEFDRILDGFDGPFETIRGYAVAPSGHVTQKPGAAGFLLSHEQNDAAIATNRLLAAGEDVYWIKSPLEANGKSYPAGTIYIPNNPGEVARLTRIASSLGISVDAIAAAPSGDALKLRPVRIGLWDQYGGSMPSGWTRWLLEKFEFPFEVVYPKTLDAGNLSEKFDILVFVTGAIPESDRESGGFAELFSREPDPSSIPAEYRERLGSITVATTVPRLIEFLEQGGTIITIGSSTILARHAGLPMADHLVDGNGKHLTQDVYYVPGSVLQVRVDNSRPLAYGMKQYADVFFDNSPVFRMLPDAQMRKVEAVAWFANDTPLRSGWAWGQNRLNGGVAVAEAKVGKGNLFLFGPEILNRGQPHGTFKFFFNGIYLAGATTVRLDLTN
ncbi:MAG: M14 metallopeptidase family protein [Gemmatimonadales bacterium]